ncbi:MAG TPA: hypothetical protein VFL94_07130 [Actinomycetales bacterium]|nr:hypothetical protein [Actinomycetales bacterium]
MSEQPQDESTNSIEQDDQDSEPTMKAPDDRRPDGTVADLHGEGTDDASGASGS